MKIKHMIYPMMFLVLILFSHASAEVDENGDIVDSGVLNLENIGIRINDDNSWNISLGLKNTFSFSENSIKDMRMDIVLSDGQNSAYKEIYGGEMLPGQSKSYNLVLNGANLTKEDVLLNITINSSLNGSSYIRRISAPYGMIDQLFNRTQESKGLVSQEYSAQAFPCAPSACDAGYTDDGITCLDGVCTRQCSQMICDRDWGSERFHDDVQLDNSAGSISAETGTYHISSSSNYCWQFENMVDTQVEYAPLNAKISSYTRAFLMGDGSSLKSETTCNENTLYSYVDTHFYCFSNCNEVDDSSIEICNCQDKYVSLKGNGRSYANIYCSGSYALNPPYGNTYIDVWFNIYKSYASAQYSNKECSYQVQCSVGDSCCDEYGRYRPSSYKCQDNLLSYYGCPWGIGEGSDVGLDHYDQYCTGYSGWCEGNIVADGNWIVQAYCGDGQRCLEGSDACFNPSCFDKTDCGIDEYTGDPYCSNNDVYQPWTTRTCNNGGQTDAYCSNSDSAALKQDCGDTTYGDWGANECSALNGDVVHTRTVNQRGCSAGSCYSTPTTDTQMVTDCQYGCIAGQCAFPACYANSGCGTDGWIGSTFCNNNDIDQNYMTYSCNNASTIYASCSNSTSSRYRSTCAYGCMMVSGSAQCDPNGPPQINSFYVTPTTVNRTENITVTAVMTDPNGWSDITNFWCYIYHPSTNWIVIPYQYQGSGNTGTMTCKYNVPANSVLDSQYSFYVQVMDSKGKSSSQAIWNVLKVNDYPTQFTIPVEDHTTLYQPAVKGEFINFTTNIYDPDSLVKLLICDSKGLTGTSCNSTQYCSQGLKSQGEFNCPYSTSSTQSGEYNWTSYAINDFNVVRPGANGSFYVMGEPLNPRVKIGNQNLWSYSGYYNSTQTLTDFKTQLQAALAECIPDQDGFCRIPLTAIADSAGFMELSDLRIEYYLKQNLAPQIFYMDNITVNEGDLVEIHPQAYDPNGDNITFNISAPVGNDGLWQTTELDDGNYTINITASDGKLSTLKQILLRVLELINPGMGGVIEYLDVKMIIPAGSLPPDKFTDVQIKEVNETDYLKENGLKVVGHVYQFSPSGVVFDPPIRVEIKYNESEVDNESLVDAYLYKLVDEANHVYRWVPLGASVDTERNVLVVYLTHFSEYAVQEMIYDIEAPRITIYSPQKREYPGIQGSNLINFSVEDDKDFDPEVTVYIDDAEVNLSSYDPSVLSYGAHSIKIIAVDEVNNTANATVEFYISDVQAPITTVSGVPQNWTSGNITAIFSVPDPSASAFYCVDRFDTCQPNISSNQAVISEEGISYLRYLSRDELNSEVVRSVIIKIDNSLPYTLIQSIPDAGEVNITELTDVTLTPSDNLSGIKEFMCTYDGTICPSDRIIKVDQQGHHVLIFKSIDNASNQEQEKVMNINLDSTPPVSIMNPSKAWLNARETSINITCQDNWSGCDEISYTREVGDALKVLKGKVIYDNLSYSPGQVTYHNISYSSTDTFGNKEDTISIMLGIDDIPPQIIFNNLYNGSWYVYSNITVNYTATDVGSGIANVTFIVDGKNVTNDTIDSSMLRFGENRINATVTDVAGNMMTEESIFMVDSESCSVFFRTNSNDSGKAKPGEWVVAITEAGMTGFGFVKNENNCAGGCVLLPDPQAALLPFKTRQGYDLWKDGKNLVINRDAGLDYKTKNVTHFTLYNGDSALNMSIPAEAFGEYPTNKYNSENKEIFTCSDSEFCRPLDDCDGDGVISMYDCDRMDASKLPPYDGLVIRNNVTFCSGNYSLSDEDGDGTIVRVEGDGITVNCNKTTITGTGAETAISVNGSIDWAKVMQDTKNLSDFSIILNRSVAEQYFEEFMANSSKIEDIEIKNCIMSNFQKGIDAKGGRNIRIINNSFADSGAGIISIFVADSYIGMNNFTGISGSGNEQGALLAFGKNISIELNNVTNSSLGLGAVGFNNRILNNTVSGTNIGVGSAGYSNQMIGNKVYNSDTAAGLAFAYDSIVQQNELNWSNKGFSMTESSRNQIVNNVIMNNKIGINVEGLFSSGPSENNYMINNTINGSTEKGIVFSDMTLTLGLKNLFKAITIPLGGRPSRDDTPLHVIRNNTISGNKIGSNGTDDFYVKNIGNDTIYDNRVFSNMIYGSGVNDSTELNSYCVNNVGNTYLDSAIGPICPACYNDLNCSYLDNTSERYCSNGSVYRTITDAICINPGKSGSYCQATTERTLQEECSFVCSRGSCLNDSCRVVYRTNVEDGNYSACYTWAGAPKLNCWAAIDRGSGLNKYTVGPIVAGGPLLPTNLITPDNRTLYNISGYFDYLFVLSIGNNWNAAICPYGSNCWNTNTSNALNADITLRPINPYSEKGQEVYNCSPVCILDSNCANDNYTNAAFCYGNVTQRTFRDYGCANPGKYNSSCMFTDSNVTIETCKYGCVNGTCRNLSIQGYVLNTNRSLISNASIFIKVNMSGSIGTWASINNNQNGYYNFSLSDLTVPFFIQAAKPTYLLYESQTFNPFAGDVFFNITMTIPNCTKNSDCGNDSYINSTFCSGEQVFRKYRTFTCSLPSTYNATCSHVDTDMNLSTCQFGCLNGTCKPDPCLNVTCNDYCGGRYGFDYYSSGRCDAGLCNYSSLNINSTSCGFTPSNYYCYEINDTTQKSTPNGAGNDYITQTFKVYNLSKINAISIFSRNVGTIRMDLYNDTNNLILLASKNYTTASGGWFRVNFSDKILVKMNKTYYLSIYQPGVQVGFSISDVYPDGVLSPYGGDLGFIVQGDRCVSPEQACDFVSCNDHCEGNTYRYGGTCTNGTCSYSTEENSASCICRPFLDQSQNISTMSMGGDSAYGALGQTFMTGNNTGALSYIDVYLWANATSNSQIELYAGRPASSYPLINKTNTPKAISIDSNLKGWYRYNFTKPVRVSPNTQYYMQTWPTVNWGLSGDNPYASGDLYAYNGDTLVSGYDFEFMTYSTSLECACLGVTCNSSCNGYTYNYNGTCNVGTCVYTQKQNATECGYSACWSDSNCLNDTYLGSPFCAGNLLNQTFRDYRCINPGTQNASCVYADINQTKQTCQFGCLNSTCKPDPCLNVTCNDYCNNATYTRYQSGFCLAGQCVYQEVNNSSICGFNPACSNDSACYSLNSSMYYCDIGKIYYNMSVGSCVNPGTMQSYCQATKSRTFVNNCSFGCMNGQCSPDPCSGVVCNDYCNNATYTNYVNGRCVPEVIFRTNALNGNYTEGSWISVYVNGSLRPSGFYMQKNYGATWAGASTKLNFSSSEGYGLWTSDLSSPNWNLMGVMTYGNPSNSNGTGWFFKITEPEMNNADLSTDRKEPYASQGQEVYRPRCVYDAVNNSAICGFNTVCRVNADCGTDQYIGNVFCNGNYTQQTYKNNTCLNPGMVNATCIASYMNNTLQTCQYGCSAGVCNGDPCLTMTCNDYCGGIDGFSYYYGGSCSQAQCHYSVSENNLTYAVLLDSFDNSSSWICGGSCSGLQINYNNSVEGTTSMDVQKSTTGASIQVSKNVSKQNNTLGKYARVSVYFKNQSIIDLLQQSVPAVILHIGTSMFNNQQIYFNRSQLRPGWNHLSGKLLVNNVNWVLVEISPYYINEPLAMGDIKFDYLVLYDESCGVDNPDRVDPCSYLNCSDTCSGTTNLVNGTCIAGSCTYTQIANSTQCGYVPPACNSDSDCLNDTYIESPFCAGADLRQPFRDYSCSNPGTQNASCVYSDTNQTLQTCQHGCSAGVCNGDPCSGVICNQQCNGTSKLLNGTCSGGICSYTNVINSTDCGYISPACWSDSDCTSDLLIGLPFCIGNNLDQVFRDYSCSEPGTPNASCVYSDTNNTLQTCQFGCSGGACNGDPCASVSCADACNGTTNMINGSCSAGSCIYTEVKNSTICGFVDLDLFVDSGQLLTASPVINSAVAFKYGIKNSGKDNATGIYLLLDTGSADNHPRSANPMYIEGGKTKYVYMYANYSIPGNYTTNLSVDYDNLIKESNETNNMYQIKVEVR